MKIVGFFALIATSVMAMASSASTELSAPGPRGPLKGTFVEVPNRQAPVVLIVPGSGPIDRDGNSPSGIQASTYKMLAEGLAREGISTLRIDKRGLFGSVNAVSSANAVSISDYVEDVVTWIDVIRQRTQVPCVWVMGHSEGGLVALVAGAQHPRHICGLILVSTAGRPIGEVLKEQLRANSANAPILADANYIIDEISSGRRVDISNIPSQLQGLLGPEIQGYLLSLFSIYPDKIIKSIHMPIKIVQGDRDVQVSVEDARLLKRANHSAELTLLRGVNHVLKPVITEDIAENTAAYMNPDLPLDPMVVPAIEYFIRRHSASKLR